MTSLSHCLSYFLFLVRPVFSSSSSLPLCWHPIISLWADGWAWEWMGGLGGRGREGVRGHEWEAEWGKLEGNPADVELSELITQVKSLSPTCSLSLHLILLSREKKWSPHCLNTMNVLFDGSKPLSTCMHEDRRRFKTDCDTDSLA